MAPLGRGELLLNHEPPSNGGWQHRRSANPNSDGRPTDRGAAEEPSTDIGPEGGVDGPRWTRGAAGT
ncbi:hypothetical protein THAOC_02287 [Thalassiosira oceanica]|uniref:Uncharacterized protein n=1 Tax=Thalassiosira oceanica TaxID=159749 RepID=K0TB22_THAOC|nr:hypothetical protein THAOC_02287 [Thalassiosira oceanica]|eukprot:EJK75973.1 hypothetical protein THAOC_02287 [Thalassiosira oceanica]